MIFFGTEQPTPEMYIRCGKNAMKNLDVFHVIDAFEKADSPIPKRSFEKVGRDLLIRASGGQIIDLRAALKVYQHLEIEIPMGLLDALLEIIKDKKYTNWYIQICKQLGRDPEKEILQNFFDHNVSELNADNVEYLAGLLKKKLSKTFLIKLGKKAFSVEKYDAGKEFFEMAYSNNDEAFFK